MKERPEMQDVLTATQVRSGADVAEPVNAFFDAINAGDTAAALALLDPSCLHHGRVSNYRPEGVRVLFGMLRSVFPDLELDVREQRVEGRRVVSRIVATATHTGSFLGKPPTGRPLVWQSVDIAEVGDEGTIVNRFWDIWGDPTLWREIGFTPALMC
jgi:predicted ester cyclase